MKGRAKCCALCIMLLVMGMITACSRNTSTESVIAIDTGVTTCYMLECTEGYMLIDTGYPDDYTDFRSQLKERNIELQDIKYLLLTHHHDDHAGFASALMKDTGARLIVHEKAVAHLARGESENTSRPLNTCVKAVFSLYSLVHSEFKFSPVNVGKGDIVVRGDNDTVLPRIGIQARVLYTPGHTDDSISVLLPNGTAIVGDVAMDMMNFCCCRKRPIFVQDMDAVKRSWRKLIDAGAKVIFPAHGQPFPVQELIEYLK